MSRRPPSNKVRFPGNFAALITRAVKLCEAQDVEISSDFGGPLHNWVKKHCTYKPEQEIWIVGVLAMELAERKTKWNSLLSKSR